MKMNKLILIISAPIFLLLPQSVWAEDVSITTNDSSVKVKIEQRINTVKNNIIERKEIRVENRNENRDEKRAEFAKKHAERLQKRFDAYYERLTKIIAKVKVRITDNTEAKVKLTEAEEKLDEAKKMGDEAVALFNGITTGNLGSNSEVVKNAKDKAELARNAFKETLKLIRDAFQLVKGNNER